MGLIYGAASRFVVVALVLGFTPLYLIAQTQYYNLDGGRPGRVEDAEPTGRYSLGLDVGPFEFEHLVDGTRRYRVEPKLSYGVLPFTELELRVPVVRVDPAAAAAHSITGVASVAVSALHAFNLETPSRPALAVGGEVTLPVGTLAGPQAAYLLKVLSTKTTSAGRLHLNVGAGTYSVRTSPVAAAGTCTPGSGFGFTLPGQPTCSGTPPIIIDTPCSVAPSQPAALRPSLMCMGAQSAFLPPPDAVTPRSQGAHWMAGAGIDHPFALQSTLLTADLVAERFVGLYSRNDWTAETGVRHQVTPLLMVDAGIGWHFAGVVRSTSLTFGASYEIATRPHLASHGAAPSRSTSYEQTYLRTNYNWVFRDRFPSADHLLDAFDYGHAILYQTLLTNPDAARRLEGPEFARVTQQVLRHPPVVPLEEAAVGPDYVKLVPEVVATFEWAHMLHRQLYDVWSAYGLTQFQRDAEVQRLIAYYRSRPDLALSTRPKSMSLMEGQPYSLGFRKQDPKFNGLLWSYHWFQMALYDALMGPRNDQVLHASTDSVVARFFRMLADAPAHMPTEMPMSMAAAPQFSERYPDAAIIFDNLHSLHDVVSDILVSPLVPSNQKRAAILAAAAAYRDDTTAVISVDEWRDMSRMMAPPIPP